MRRVLVVAAVTVVVVGGVSAVVAVLDGDDVLLLDSPCPQAYLVGGMNSPASPERVVDAGPLRDAFTTDAVEVAADDPSCVVVRRVQVPSEPDACSPAVVSTLVVQEDDGVPVVRAVSGRPEGARRVDDCNSSWGPRSLLVDLAVALDAQQGDVLRLDGRGEVTVGPPTPDALVVRGVD